MAYYPQRKQYGQYNTYNKGSGAREGLEQKMTYWKEKDKVTEYNILIGQATNLALEDIHKKENPLIDEQEHVNKWVRTLLVARLNPANRTAYEDYQYSLKNAAELKLDAKADIVADETNQAELDIPNSDFDDQFPVADAGEPIIQE